MGKTNAFKKTAVAVIALIVVLLLTFSAFSPFKVDAGASVSGRVDSNSFSENVINSGAWRVNGNVKAVDGKIVFDNGCSADALLVSKSIIRNNSSYGLDEFARISTTLKINSIASGARFSYVFGFNSIRSEMGANNTLELVFKDSNGSLSVGLVKYVNGSAVTIEEAKVVDGIAYGTEFSLSGTIYYSKKFNLSIGSTAIYNGADIGFVPEGYFAMGQNGGKNEVYVSKVDIDSFTYETPTNGGDITETFDNGCYNANAWYSETDMGAFTPCSLSVQNGVLRFENAGSAHITSRYKYSNFELSFDFLDYQNEAVYDSKGNLLKGFSSGIGVYFGVPEIKTIMSEAIRFYSYAFNIGGYDSDEDTTVYKTKSVSILEKPWTWKTVKTLPSIGVDPWDKELSDGRTINVKVQVVDMKLTAYMKYADQEWGDPVCEYVFSETPTGYVRIGVYNSPGLSEYGAEYSAVANYSIDNISLKNLDKENMKKTTTIEFKTNVKESVKDFEYTNQDDASDLLSNKLAEGSKQETSSGCSGSLCGTEISIIAIMLAAAVIAVKRLKEKR